MTLKQNETLQARSNHFINHHPTNDTAVIVIITTKHGIFRLISICTIKLCSTVSKFIYK